MTTTPTSPRPRQRLTATLKLLLPACGLAALVVAARNDALQGALRAALLRMEGLGALGLLLFIGLYIVACVFLLPGSILTLGAGVVFGVAKGIVAVSAGSTLGATAAFLVGRYLARNWVAGKFAGDARFSAIDAAVAREGWKIVLLTRLSPLFPFNLLNYAFGLTGVRLKDYVLASWLGMIPGAMMYVYIGSLAGSLASVGGARTRTTGEWVFYGAGLAATLLVTVLVTRLARKALAGRLAA